MAAKMRFCEQLFIYCWTFQKCCYDYAYKRCDVAMAIELLAQENIEFIDGIRSAAT